MARGGAIARQKVGQGVAPTKENIQKKTTQAPTYIQTIIEVYKGLKGYSGQADWDRYHYKRHVAPAKRLYEVAGEDWQGAIEWTAKQGYTDWTLETVVKKFPDYKQKKGNNPLGAAGRVIE